MIQIFDAQSDHEIASAHRIFGEHPNTFEWWAFPPEVRQRLGALAVVWSVFEATLETTLWAPLGEQVKGTRSSTDRTSIADWTTELGKV